MLMGSSERFDNADCRWRLLLGFAIVLLFIPAMKRCNGLTVSGRISAEGPKALAEMDLHWELDGVLGEGIYAHRVEKFRPVDTTIIDKEIVKVSLEEPRLAVFTSQPLDLNRIDFETLRVLTGVGPKMANAIISYRQKHGPFRRLECLMDIKGIGPAKFKVLRRWLAVEVSDSP